MISKNLMGITIRFKDEILLVNWFARLRARGARAQAAAHEQGCADGFNAFAVRVGEQDALNPSH